jgi:hypothetical protein
MTEPTKRLHYFDHQFLRAEDFNDEQAYHLTRRRLHNRLLHTWGIAEGLKLSFVAGAPHGTVGTGVAINGEGKEIILAEDAQTPETSGHPSQWVYVTIEYAERPTDPASETGVTGETRITEWVKIDISETAPEHPDKQLILGRLSVDANGEITDKDDGDGVNRRRSAGVVGGDLEVHSLVLTDPKVVPERWPSFRLGAAERADLAGSLHVAGNIEVTGTVDGRDVSADGAKLDAHVGRTDNPHNTTATQAGALVSVDGVSNPGGNIDLVPTQAIVITPSNATNQINIGENHSTRTDNPHKIKAGQIGAVPTSGGNIKGTLVIQRQTNAPLVHLGTNAFGIPPEKGLVISNPQGQKNMGIFIIGRTEDLTNVIDGETTFRSPVRFNGGKTGYVVDRCVNGGEVTIHTGDLVKLKGTPVTRFEGMHNKLPIPEVTLADKDSDTAVIGVADCEATPEIDAPDTRTVPEDPTFIPDGGELYVVTLGTYAHCKVDATEASIEVGDLLTSSAKPGHAKKATDPKIGSIIGKALEPLAEGTGYIAVFVNIQ